MAVSRMRAFLLGPPKAGKTGALLPLLKAGFRVAMLNYDDNPDPLLNLGADYADRLSLVTLQDRAAINESGNWYYPTEPSAFRLGGRALDDWSKADPTHPWGPARTWGPETVLVLDSLTALGDACLATRHFRSPRGLSIVDYGDAQRMQDTLIQHLASSLYNCHLIVTAHIKLVGPRDPMISERDRERVPELAKAREMISLARASVMPTRLFPSAIGEALAREILRRLPCSLLVYQDEKGNRWITSQPPPGMPLDLGAPVMGLPANLPQDTGLLTLMEKLCGYREPPTKTA